MTQSDPLQIPTAAFVEHFVIEEALSTGCSLKEASSSTCKRFGINQSQVFPLNETRLLALLYCLLVFPSEIWKREELLDVVLESVRVDEHLLKQNKALATKSAIRGIRNAVAHARISFGNKTVSFEDRRGNAPAHFNLKLSYQEATNLLLVLGRAFHESAQVKAYLATTGRKT